MPYTILQEKARAKYVRPKDLQEQFGISRAQIYKLLQRPELQEAVIKMGEGTIRVNLDKFFEITQKIF